MRHNVQAASKRNFACDAVDHEMIRLIVGVALANCVNDSLLPIQS